jgi:hypothetical protein
VEPGGPFVMSMVDSRAVKEERGVTAMVIVDSYV